MARLSGPRRGLVLLLSGLVGIPVLTYTGVEATSVPGFCDSCHEIEPAVASWRRSSHAYDAEKREDRADCRDCHVPAWGNPIAVAWVKAQHGVKDVYHHLADPGAAAQGDFYFRLKYRALMAVDDAVCLDCHDQIRGEDDVIETEDGELRGLHASEEALKVRCTVCHKNTGHDLYD